MTPLPLDPISKSPSPSPAPTPARSSRDTSFDIHLSQADPGPRHDRPTSTSDNTSASTRPPERPQTPPESGTPPTETETEAPTQNSEESGGDPSEDFGKPILVSLTEPPTTKPPEEDEATADQDTLELTGTATKPVLITNQPIIYVVDESGDEVVPKEVPLIDAPTEETSTAQSSADQRPDDGQVAPTADTPTDETSGPVARNTTPSREVAPSDDQPERDPVEDGPKQNTPPSTSKRDSVEESTPKHSTPQRPQAIPQVTPVTAEPATEPRTSETKRSNPRSDRQAAIGNPATIPEGSGSTIVQPNTQPIVSVLVAPAAADVPSAQEHSDSDTTRTDPPSVGKVDSSRGDRTVDVSGERPGRTEAAAGRWRPFVAAEPADQTAQIDRVRFVQRVARAFEAAGERGGEVRLRLAPPELGALRLHVTVEDGVLSARLDAETNTARHLLIDNLPALRARLADQDIRVGNIDVGLMDLRQDGSRERANEDGDWHRQNRRFDVPSHSRDNTPTSDAAEHRRPSRGNDSALNVVI